MVRMTKQKIESCILLQVCSLAGYATTALLLIWCLLNIYGVFQNLYGKMVNSALFEKNQIFAQSPSSREICQNDFLIAF